MAENEITSTVPSKYGVLIEVPGSAIARRLGVDIPEGHHFFKFSFHSYIRVLLNDKETEIFVHGKDIDEAYANIRALLKMIKLT